jgi:hypothetical protein
VPDHVEPRAAGGSFDLSNLQLTCKQCNEDKGKFTHDGFLAILNFSTCLSERDNRYLWQRLRAAGHGFSNFRGGKRQPQQDVFEPTF